MGETGNTGHDPIVVAVATDAAYLPFALVVAESIARTAGGDRPVEFHVLYDGRDQWAVGALERYRRGPVRCFVHRLANPFARLGVINAFPASTFFRHALPAVLKGYRRAIYLDVDVIVETDVAPLFDADLKGNCIGGVMDTNTVIGALLGSPDERPEDGAYRWRWYFREMLGRRTDEEFLDFVQSGVLLMDLDMQREMKLDEQMMDTALKWRGRLYHAQQGVLNKLLIGRMTMLDPIWNRTAIMLYPEKEAIAPPLVRDQARRQREIPGILHFGGAKPWVEFRIKGSNLWWRVALRSPARLFAVSLALKLLLGRWVRRTRRRLLNHRSSLVRAGARRLFGADRTS
jgi:lipopolysaccharide biosynthesis glycosyltransferase